MRYIMFHGARNEKEKNNFEYLHYTNLFNELVNKLDRFFACDIL